jgi:tetratricopeptide (TPR) repeat protein
MWLSWAVTALLLFQAASPVEEGLKALDEERYEAAAVAFETALEADPENFGAHFNLAFAYTMLGRQAEAISGYEKALELKPGLYQAQLNLGVLLLEAKEVERALPYLKAAVAQKADQFRPQYYLAVALYESADDAGAEAAYRRAAELDPAAADVQIGLGRAIFNQGRFDEAEPHYRKAAEIDPEYRGYLVELGSKYEEKGKKEQAIGIYSDFTEDAVVQERLGHLLLQSDQVEEALPHLQSAVRRSPTSANRFALATVYIKLKQPEKALPLLDLTLQAEPNSYELLMVRGRLVRDQRRFDAAAQDFYRAAQLKPDSKEAWREFSSMLIMLENYPQALAALDKVEALGDPPPSVHYFRALIWDQTRQYEQALPNYERFLELCQGKFPDEEFKARQRIKAIKRELRR